MTGHAQCKTELIAPIVFLPPRRIIAEVAAAYGELPEVVTGRSRTPVVTSIRCLAVYLLRKLTPMSLEAIGDRLGNRDHTTIAHALRRCTSEMARNAKWRAAVESLEQRLREIAEEESNDG